jgi:hypothetical protein
MIDGNRGRSIARERNRRDASVDYLQIFQSIARFDSSAAISSRARWSVTSGTERNVYVRSRYFARPLLRTHIHTRAHTLCADIRQKNAALKVIYGFLAYSRARHVRPRTRADLPPR